MSDNGSVSIVIPCDIMHEWEAAAAGQNLYPTRITFIKTTPRKAPKRVLIEFRFNKAESTEESTLILESAPGEYSGEAKVILGNFYLKL